MVKTQLNLSTTIFITLTISFLLMMAFIGYYLLIGETYYIEGNFIRGEYKDPYLCCGYDWTVIVLKNYTITGDIKTENGKFIFDNIFQKIDNLQTNHRYRFYYSKHTDFFHGETYYFLKDVKEVSE